MFSRMPSVSFALMVFRKTLIIFSSLARLLRDVGTNLVSLGT
jgi:hypothetical protein